MKLEVATNKKDSDAVVDEDVESEEEKQQNWN